MAHLGSFPHTFEDGPGNTASGVEVMDNLGFLKSGVDAVDDRVTSTAGDVTSAAAVAAAALPKADNLASIASAAAARGNLGLGSAATHPAGDFALAPTVVSSLPGSPTNGQEVYYYPSAGTLWHLKYMGYLGAGWTTYGNWFFVGGVPLVASADAVAAKSSVTYANPSTGTAMTLDLPMVGLYEVRIEATITPPASTNAEAWISFKTSATAASDDNGAVVNAAGSGTYPSAAVGKTSLIAVTAARTLTEQLRASAGSCAVNNRRLIARPVAIG